MVSITCYGGANEIGGNKILLEDKGVKIYLDFGQSFSFGEEFFYEYLEPRSANGLEVYFEFGMLPKLKGLYSAGQLRLTDLKYVKTNVDAVLISHGHSDHIGHLSFIDESVPIYMGHGTHRITEVYHDLYPSLSNIGEHNDIRLFRSGDKFKIKHLIVEPIHVDHSIPGAYGFIIQTSMGSIIYTGDFRMHGPRNDMSKEFMKKATAAKPYALICEGTRMGYESEHNYTEKEVEKRAHKIISTSKGLVFVYFSMSNIDRFLAFYRATRKNNRVLVISTNLAHIISNLRDKIPTLPDVMKDPFIRVYYRMAKSCTFCEKDYYVWERLYMGKMITYKELVMKPKAYVMHLGFYKLIELVYIQPKNADFIYSMSEHFFEGEDNEEQRTVWENWMKHFGITFHKAHSSGHASQKDLIEFIRAVDPEVLIPVHTQNSEEFKREHHNVKIPQKGERLELYKKIRGKRREPGTGGLM